MSKLTKKLFNDIRFNLSQFITIFLMIFIGVMAYCGIRAYMDGMQISADIFYTDCNLQDLDVVGEDFSDEDLQNIKNIEHVVNAERKLTITGSMLSGDDITLQLNFIESNEIAKFYVVDGEEFDKEKSGVWLDEYFANKNKIKVGSTIGITYDGTTIHERVLGLINVPDHVYDIKDESALFPNHIDYGFAYMSINELTQNYAKKAAMEKAGIPYESWFDKYVPDFDANEFLVYNYIMVDVDDEVNKNYVKDEIESKIESAIAVTDIKDSFSYETYQGEIEEGETYIGVFSGLFLFIAVLSVITTMTRVVKKQRVQIGTLKALGFKKRKVTLHYIGYGFWISLFSSIIGIFAGRFLIGNMFIGMEMSYFEVPNGMAVISESSFIVAAAVVVVVSIVTYLTCRGVLKENAADTLRTEIPKVKSSSINITTKGIFKHMSFSSKWNIRDVFRNKMRTLMGIAGVTGCCMLLVCSFGMLDSINHFISLQFEELYNFDYKLSLKTDYTDEQLSDLIGRYGNNTSQTLGIEIKNGDAKDANTIFVDNSNNYVRFLNQDEEYISLRDDGIFVTQKLAEIKGYEIGDTITWHIYGEDTYYDSKIVGFDRDPQNQNVKMTKAYLESLGIEYKPDTIYTNDDMSEVKNLDGVEIIQNIDSIKDGMENMIGTMKSMIVLIIAIAALLGSVIIYNLGILSFTEKQYQFATLKVLGFSDSQIKKIFIKQNNWITIISIILGLPLGFYMTDFIFRMALAEAYDFSASINLISYIYAIIGTYVVSFIVSKILARKVEKIDMVSSLKGNE